MTNTLHLVETNTITTEKKRLEIASSTVEKLCYECQIKQLPFMLRNVHEFVEKGLDHEMLDYLIDITLMAHKPSFAYFDCIARFCIRNKLFTPEEHMRQGRKKLHEEQELADIYKNFRFSGSV